MLFTLALLGITIPALTGWGLGTVWLVGKLGAHSPSRFDFLEPMIGLAVGALLVNLENFLYPVSFEFAFLFLFAGWGLFLVSLPRFNRYLTKPFWIFCIFLWLGIISIYGVLPAFNYDAGLYHLPTIRWLVESPVPFGLANLHGRLAFNSTWLSISAVLAQVTAPYTPNYAALASESLIAVWGIAILSALYKFVNRKANDLATIFLCLAGVIYFAPIVTENLSSPSTDHPILFFSLALVYVFLRAIETKEPSAFLYEFWLSVLLALCIITIKISVLPLCLIPVSLLLIGYRRRLGIQNWKNLLPAIGTTILFLASWFARGIILSGCLIYPVTGTCLQDLPWAIHPAQSEAETVWIMSWARAPGNYAPAQVLANWNWMRPWLRTLAASMDFILPLICLGIGFALILVTWRPVRVRHEFPNLVWLVIVSVIGIFYWFFTAPDLRFGSAWFWIPGLLVPTAALLALNTNQTFNTISRWFICIILISAAISFAAIGVRHARGAGLSFPDVLYAVPRVAEAKLEVRVTEQGIPINVPLQGDQCYWTLGYCTPLFMSGITILRAQDNRAYIYRAR